MERGKFTYFNLKPENVLLELHRHKETMIGFEDEVEYLNSNTYNIDHNIYVRVKLADFSLIKSNEILKVEPVIEDPKNKKIKEEKKKKPVAVKDNKKDKNQIQQIHPLIEEIKAEWRGTCDNENFINGMIVGAIMMFGVVAILKLIIFVLS